MITENQKEDILKLSIKRKDRPRVLNLGQKPIEGIIHFLWFKCAVEGVNFFAQRRLRSALDD